MNKDVINKVANMELYIKNIDMEAIHKHHVTQYFEELNELINDKRIENESRCSEILINDLNDINDKTECGKLLMMAIARLTCRVDTNKTPYEVISMLNKQKLAVHE